MGRIKQSSIEEVRSRVGLADLISNYVSLKKSGSAYRGLSPFSHEKTPSFFVYPDKGFYYCFSTSQGGDIFKFVMAKENLNFPEAVEFIAKKYAITLEYESDGGSGTASQRKQLFDMHEDAADWYSKQFFSDSEEAGQMREYWTRERGFTLEDAKELRIGFAPADPSGLRRLFASKKYDPAAIAASGIFSARDGEKNLRNFYPRFRGRLMIPICDIQGRVIAFTARKTKFTPDAPSEEGKYVNSRDTEIFKKNLVVFNMDKAKNFAKEKNTCIVVEGQLDAVRMFCAGFKNTVATQGTAAGAEHFGLIKRYADKVVLLFDGDSAGQRAALRVIPICFRAELEPFVAVIPGGDDPDSFIKKFGADAMRELVENGKKTALSFAAKHILSDIPSPTPQDRRSAMLSLFEMVSACKSNVLRDDHLREISYATMTDLTSVSKDYSEWEKRRISAGRGDGGDQGANPAQGMLTNSIYDALLVCLHYDNVAKALSEVLDDVWIRGNSTEARTLKKILALYREGLGFSLSEIDAFFDSDDEKNLIYKICCTEKSSIENPIQYANECIKKIYKNFYADELEALNKKLLEVSRSDQDESIEILKKISRIRRESKNPPARIEEE